MMPEHKPFQLSELHLLAIQVNCIEMGQDWSALYRQHVARLINEVRRHRAHVLCAPLDSSECWPCQGLGYDWPNATEDDCPECDGTGKSAEARLVDAVIPDYLASETQVDPPPDDKPDVFEQAACELEGCHIVIDGIREFHQGAAAQVLRERFAGYSANAIVDKRIRNPIGGYFVCSRHGDDIRGVVERILRKHFGQYRAKLEKVEAESTDNLNTATLNHNHICDLNLKLKKARDNAKAIIIRCTEGDKTTDWLPVIARLAKEIADE